MGHMLDRRALLSAVVTIVAVILAACGGGDATSTRAPATPVSTAPVATATATVLAPNATPAPTSPAATATAVAAPSATPAPTATRPAVATGTPVAQPKYGGILVRRFISDPSTPDLYDVRGNADINGFMAIFNNLILINPYNEAELIGDLAESWAVGDNGLKLTFKLRQGVQWHDGKPSKAADVVYTYNRAITPPSPAIGRNAPIFSPAIKAEASDDTTVIVTLKRPSNSFLLGIGSSTVPILPSQLQDMTEFTKNPIGTGPFKISNRRVNIDMDLAKNGAYWRRDGRGNPLPYLDGMHVITIVDNAAAYAAFRTGRIDLMSPYEGRAITPAFISGQLQRDLPDVIIGTNFANRTDLQLNMTPALKDQRVRKAIHLAFDRQTMAKIYSASQGFADALVGPLTPPELGGRWGIPQSELAKLPGYRPDKTADVAEAKRLLQEAGVDPKAVTLRFVALGAVVAEADAIISLVGSLGFTVKFQSYPTSGEVSEVLLRGDFDFYRSQGTPNFDDPSTYLTQFVKTNGGANFGKWSDGELDRLLDLQDSELDTAKRKTLLLEVQRRVLDDLFIIPLYGNSNYPMWYPYVKNVAPWSLAFGTQWRFEEVWLSK